MNALKEPERITLAEGLALLKRHVPAEEAKARLWQVFIQRALIQSQLPLIALPDDDADIDWATGFVKIPGTRRFCPTFLRADFNAYFFEEHTAGPAAAFEKMETILASSSPPLYARQTVISAADMLKALGHTGFDHFLLELDLPDKSVGQSNLFTAPPTSLAAAVQKKDLLETFGLGGFDRFSPEGGLMARATSLAEYAIKNPEQLMPGRRTVAYEIIRRAAQLWREGVTSDLREGDRERFAAAMQREGQAHMLSDEQVNFAPDRLPDATKSSAPPSRPPPRKVFIVHGHDEAAKVSVARFLETIGFEAIVLHEQVNRGLTIIEKFEVHSDVGFAVVLLTPDDFGGEGIDETKS